MFIGEDNQACVADAEKSVLSDMSKHVDLKYQVLVDNVENGNVRLRFVQKDNTVTDMLTKHVGAIKFCRIVSLAGMN